MTTRVAVFVAMAFAAVVLHPAAQSKRSLTVSTVSELARAMTDARPGDVIEMTNGTWTDAHIEFVARATEQAPVILRAQTPGRVALTGTSTLRINAPYLVVEGLRFVRSTPVESRDPVIELGSEHGTLRDVAVENYNPPDFDTRYHWVRFSGHHNLVQRCVFTGKNHQGPVIALAGNATYNAVRDSYFKDIPHASPNGREIIQAAGYGSSEELGEGGGFMTIERNLFERADGEGAEIISLKSNRNVVRFNTIRDTRGAIVGRSGNYNVIEGNIIIGGRRPGSAGIRLSGQGHRATNNYVADVAGIGLTAADVGPRWK